MPAQLVILTRYNQSESMDIQNRKLQDLLDEGWRIQSITPAGGGGASDAHSVVFLLEWQPRKTPRALTHARKDNRRHADGEHRQPEGNDEQ